MNDAIVRTVLRSIAVAIAVAAAIDPPITSNRSVRPVVVVSALDSIRDAAIADRVAKTVGKEFTIARSNVAGASAAVIVGDRLPTANIDYPSPAFAVAPDTTGPSVSIERIDVPAAAPSAARIPVTIRIVVHGASGRSVDVTLRAGASVADRATRRFGRDDSTLTIPLSFVPTTVGPILVRVTATLPGADIPATADAAVNIRDRKWAVLFFDPRPSWTSTFVRRAIERDARFVVTSRVVTSRNVSTDAGRPPATLGDPAGLSPFDAIVVGAPEGLSPADIAGLDAFMRRRGGSIVFLLDQRVAGGYDRLTGVTAWSSSTTSSASLPSIGRDSAALRATDLAWPTVLPAGATTITSGARPVVWESPVGAGRLVVSGALDAWRFRDSSASGFDEFWRTAIADAADAAPPPISAAVSSPIVGPGEMVEVRASVRDAAVGPALTNVAISRTVRASIAATLGVNRQPAASSQQPVAGSQQPVTSSQQPLRLWPESDAGQFRGTVRAPRTPGVYGIGVASNGATADVPFIVASDVRRPRPSARNLLDAWATAHGGRMLRASDIAELPAALRDAIRPPHRVETWHPMRSAWWIVPFVLALSGEWWLRRRRGLP